MLRKITFIALLVSNSVFATHEPNLPYARELKRGLHKLMGGYQEKRGGWGDIDQQWWQQSRALDLLIKYMDRTKDFQYWPKVVNSFNNLQVTSPGYKNNYNDDMLWWAMLWTETHRFILDNQAGLKKSHPKIDLEALLEQTLNVAVTLYEMQIEQWGDNSYQAGLTWEDDGSQINAIENILFPLVGYLLFLETKKDFYLSFADEALSFFIDEFIDDKSNLIIDGPINIKNIEMKHWSYTHGIFIQAIINRHIISELYPHLTPVDFDIDAFTENAISRFSERGVMAEFYGNLDQNQQLFKGIFTLAFYNYSSHDLGFSIKSFLERQVKEIQSITHNLNELIPATWNSEGNKPGNFITQVSGLSPFLALIMLDI